MVQLLTHPGAVDLRRLGATFARFGMVGASGMVVNIVALAVFASVLGVPYLIGALLATQVSTTWNFLLSDRFVFDSSDTRRPTTLRFLQFAALNNAAFLGRGPLIVLFTESLGLHYLLSNTISLLLFTVIRFGVSHRFIWRSPAGRGIDPTTEAPGALVDRRDVAICARAVDAEADVSTRERSAARRVPSPSLSHRQESEIGLRRELAVVSVDEPAPSESRRSAILWVVVIAVLAVVLRTYAIDAVGLNSDEIVYGGQGGSISGDTDLLKYFPIFRAHPLLFQTTLSVVFQAGDGMSGFSGRVTAAMFGLGTIGAVFLLGRTLYGNRVGALSALLLAVMPYHVVVTRQILLDGPMVFFSTCGLYLLARYARSHEAAWLYSAAAVFGLMFVTNERSIVLFGGIYGFFAMSSKRFIPLGQLVTAGVVLFMVALPYPVSVKFSGRTSTGEQFLSWQLFRRANHTPDFYPLVIPPAISIAICLLAVAGIVLAWRHRSWRETLLLWWIGVPVVFFQVWNVKGYQYLLPIAPAVAVLAAKTLGALLSAASTYPREVRWPRAVAWTLVVLAIVLPARTSWQLIDPDRPRDEVVAGTGGVPGGREAGLWIRDNVPEGARLLTVGPSMANIVQYYGDRKSFGLSVSPNPLHRNPVYEPVINPDLQLRSSEIQYLVWDSFSASRSQFFSDKLLTFADRYNGRAVHTEYITVLEEDGVPTEVPIIVIYEVRP